MIISTAAPSSNRHAVFRHDSGNNTFIPCRPAANLFLGRHLSKLSYFNLNFAKLRLPNHLRLHEIRFHSNNRSFFTIRHSKRGISDSLAFFTSTCVTTFSVVNRFHLWLNPTNQGYRQGLLSAHQLNNTTIVQN